MVVVADMQPQQIATRAMESATVKTVPNRPAISDVLIRASANVAFRARLLTNPKDALAEMNLPPEDVEILTDVQAPTLKEYARQVKMRLLVVRPWVSNPLQED